MAHPLAVAGLIANMAGALLLLPFPPTVIGFTADGYGISGGGAFTEDPTSEDQRRKWRRKYVRRKCAFYLALGLLATGFFLQLLDLLGC